MLVLNSKIEASMINQDNENQEGFVVFYLYNTKASWRAIDRERLQKWLTR